MSEALPTTTIRPGATWRLGVVELWRYRDLVLVLAARDLRLRYRQTLFGVAWVALQPLAVAGAFTFVFQRIAGLDAGEGSGASYFAFALAGLLAWTAFSTTLTRSSLSLVQNAALVSKVWFPRLALPVSQTLSAAVDLVVGLILVLAVLLLDGQLPGPEVLLLPVWFLLVEALALGLGLVLAALVVRYRDVQHALPLGVQLLLFVSPVAYAIEAAPAGARDVLRANPLTGLLEAFRWSLLGSDAPGGALAWSAVAAVAALLAGALLFRHAERRFADVI